MALYTTLHLHDVSQGHDADYARRFSAEQMTSARAAHDFRKISDDRFWTGGIACGGDLSVYSR